MMMMMIIIIIKVEADIILWLRIELSQWEKKKESKGYGGRMRATNKLKFNLKISLSKNFTSSKWLPYVFAHAFGH